MSFDDSTRESNLSGKFMIDTVRLQELQDVYAQVANLFIFCVDEQGKRVTEMSGNPEEIARVVKLLDEMQIRAAINRVLFNTVEEQVIENTEYHNMKIATVGVRVGGTPAFAWFICGIGPDEGGENDINNFESTIPLYKFNASVDLIREVSNRIYGEKYTTANAVADAKRAISTTEEMQDALKRSEAMTGVVSQLGSDEAFEIIANRVLDYTGKYAEISHAYILRPNRDGNGIEIIGSYVATGQSPLDPVIDIMSQSFLSQIGDQTRIISYRTRIDEKNRDWLDSIGVSAAVAIPIAINGKTAMYAFYVDNKPNREWGIEEVKFFGDATKVIQSSATNRIQRNSITSSYKSLETILDNVGSAIYVRDVSSSNIVYVNRMCKNTFENEIKSGAIVALFEESSRYNTASSYREVNYKERNRWYDVTSTNMTWVDGRRVVLYAIIDVTEKKQYQKKIEQQANNDFLTGLYNRMCCERDLLRIIDEAKECGGKGAVIYLDLDDFKHINDGLGHQYGDVLLKAISSSLTRINGVENTCYRMGGDEFVILVPHTSYDRFEQIIESIRVVFNKPWFLKGADYYCTSSIGVVTFPDEGETVQDLIRKADIAMYTAKKSGKNKLAHYTDSSDEEAYKRLDMEKSMRAATATDYDQFEVYYQPIVDITKPGNPCTGAEALIRWNSTELGFISPADFIPLAEYLGLINPIGHHVLQKACEAVKYWNENGHPYYKVNVNLSVVQLMQNDIVDTIAKTIEETEVNPRNLTLEVTESLAINDMERMKRILGNIKKLGIRIALDDFGTGYSSLNHIREIPLDVIKVDQSFVKDLATDQYAQSFVRMIGELADALGVRVCVEGIETAEQFKALENMNVRMVQGFYFDKPMPRYAFEEKYLLP
jgi:diguanylate cyclase (GGDEF)-like protein